MAMTKKQAAEMEELRTAADRSTALGWPQFPKPVPLPKSDRYDRAVVGWCLNLYTRTVRKVWQTSLATYDSADRINGSRDLPPVYATEAEAWQAMMHELAEQFAITLSVVRKKAFPEARS